MKHGFSLIEVLVVVGLIAALSAGAVLTFSGFRKQTAVEKSVAEAVRVLRTARTNSTGGELVGGTTVADYLGNGFDTAALPVWGVRHTTGTTYELVVRYTKADGTVVTDQAIEVHQTDPTVTLTSTIALPYTVEFARDGSAGVAPALTFAVGGAAQKRIRVGTNGTFTVEFL